MCSYEHTDPLLNLQKETNVIARDAVPKQSPASSFNLAISKVRSGCLNLEDVGESRVEFHNFEGAGGGRGGRNFVFSVGLTGGPVGATLSPVLAKKSEGAHASKASKNVRKSKILREIPSLSRGGFGGSSRRSFGLGFAKHKLQRRAPFLRAGVISSVVESKIRGADKEDWIPHGGIRQLTPL